MLARGGIALGRFELIEYLGSGAFAEVVLAKDKAHGGRLVALKVLRSEALRNVTAFHRFRDEARILQRLSHPSIVEVYELLDYDGFPVIVMEYVQGASLKMLCRSSALTFPARAVLMSARSVAFALDAAFHAVEEGSDQPMCIIHRDVKPSNIMFSINGEAKLLDFGIAKGEFEDRKATSMYGVAGSAGFEAPERRGSLDDSHRTDVYALGVTLFVLLTTKSLMLPADDDRHEVEKRAALNNLDVGHEASNVLLRTLLDSMLHVQPFQRPTMKEVADDLTLVLDVYRPSSKDEQHAVAEARKFLEVRIPRTLLGTTDGEHLRFLEREDANEPPSPLTVSAARAELMAFLATEGWENRIHHLHRILDASPHFDVMPFVGLLRRCRPPRWKFWVKKTRTTEVAAALNLLYGYVTPEVRSAARTLRSHPDQRISSAARYLLEVD